MTNGSTPLDIHLVVFDDVYLEVARHADGWDSARYQNCAGILRLSPKDLERLGIKGGAHVQMTAGGETITVEVKAENGCSAGTAWLPASLYSNFLAVYDPAVSMPSPRIMKVSISPTQEDVTPISRVLQRTEHA